MIFMVGVALLPVRMNNKAEYIPKIVVYVNCMERDMSKCIHVIKRQQTDLKHGDEERGEDGFPLPNPLNHVVKVGHPKEQGAHNYCLETKCC